MTRQIVETLGRKFHEGCFKCHKCGDAVSPEQFLYDVEEEDVKDEDGGAQKKERILPVCAACNHLERVDGNPMCAWCLDPIEEEGVLALDKSWHSECFVCSRCKAPLEAAQPGTLSRASARCVSDARAVSRRHILRGGRQAVLPPRRLRVRGRAAAHVPQAPAGRRDRLLHAPRLAAPPHGRERVNGSGSRESDERASDCTARARWTGVAPGRDGPVVRPGLYHKVL